MRLSRDRNGNKILVYSPGGGVRGFSVQTLGNLPGVHRMARADLDAGRALNELNGYIKEFGTKRQRALLGWY